jgi:mono/diheme cytochrome c family protein
MAQKAGARVVRKGLIALVVAAVAWFGSEQLEFPRIFQIMFVLYAALGLIIFVLLDAPPMPSLSGRKAGIMLILFYMALSLAYIGGAAALPQYDPDDEKSKIDKLLKSKREKAEGETKNLDQLIKHAGDLDAKVQELTARLNRIVPTPPGTTPGEPPPVQATATDLVGRGMEVYELHECYNCHKIGGKGSVKKRGPILDNVGSLLTIDDIKKKVFDPTYLYAEGFEKEHKKGVMPDKYKELMTEEELDALATYLSTLKNTAIETPKPVYVKTKVEHGYIVYGYVRDAAGKALAGIEVQIKPLKEHAHPATAKTNPQGYYEVFLHLHNEDSGTKISVIAKGVQKDIVATYDPNDKVTKRQSSVDMTVPTS